MDFLEITNSGFLANNYTQTAWHPLSASDSAWDSLSPAAVADARRAGPGWTPAPAEAPGLEASLFLGQKAGLCRGGEGVLRAGLHQLETSPWRVRLWGGCNLFSPALRWGQVAWGFLRPKELPGWENVLGKVEVSPVLGLSTSLWHKSIPWGVLRLCSENNANLREERYVPDGRMGPRRFLLQMR